MKTLPTALLRCTVVAQPQSLLGAQGAALDADSQRQNGCVRDEVDVILQNSNWHRFTNAVVCDHTSSAHDGQARLSFRTCAGELIHSGE